MRSLLIVLLLFAPSLWAQEKRFIPSIGAETTVLPAASDPVAQARSVFVQNTGTGTVTISSANGRVDAVPSVSLAAGKSSMFLSDGVDWWSLGRASAAAGGTPDPHAASHQDGGSDEISVSNLSGVLGDTQKLSFMEEGVFVSERRTLNFVGSTVTLADDVPNSRVNVTITGGSGGLDLTTVEVDLGSIPRYSGTFDITGLSGLTANDPVLVMQAAGPYTGKGDRQDEAEMDQVTATGYVVDATTIRVYWVCPHKNGPLVGNVKWNYSPG